ncbi:MAG: nitroreductase family protein [Coriobacteriales bacterium]|jgi:nitroreductase
MDFLELVKNRYSCKKYDGEPVSQADLDAILEAGRLAPTAKNLQEQRIYVMRSSEALANVDELTPCRYGAPVVLVVAYDASNVFAYPGETGRTSGVEDAAIVTTHMMLAAAAQGVKSCWVNFFDPDRARWIFGLPDNEQVVALLDLGHAAEGAGPLSNHGKRKDLGMTVSYR